MSERSNKKVIVIGLDGATFDLIEPWVRKGKLPTFEKLMKEGVYGTLNSTIPYATIPAWPSFATGCNPGKHGFYDFFKEKDDGYEMTVELYPSKAIKQLTIWEILSQYGKKVVVINVPGTYPPKKINGYIITGMLTPPGARYTYPPEFQKELIEKIGEYKVFFSALSAKDPEILLKDLERTLEMRIKVTEYLWKEKKPDFLMIVDNGSDRAQHELWRFIDPLNPLYNPDEIKKFGNPLLRYYQIVDNALQRIINLLDEDTILIIMSDHGQGPLRKFVNLNMFLIQEGFMAVKKKALSRIRYFLFNHGFSPRNLYDFLRKFHIERYASDRINQERRLSLLNKFFFSTSDIDWPKTKAFASGVTGAITINLKGRQPQGRVRLGKEYEKLREEIIDKLHKLKDPETGNKVVSNVYKREEIYKGPYLNKAPDIIAIANEGYEFFGMYGFPFSQVVESTFGNSGSHRPNGIFMCVDGAEKGIIKRGVRVESVSILDIAPTILHIMGLPASPGMDGVALDKILEVDTYSLTRSSEIMKKIHSEKRRNKGKN